MMDHRFQQPRLENRPFEFVSEDGGFSMIELVVALAVLLVVMSGAIGLFSILNRTYTTQNVAAAVQQVARTGIDIMTRNIRMAGFNPLNKKTIGIVEATPQKIRFRLDLDRNGKIEADAARKEDIAFLLNRNRQLIQQYNGKNASNRSLIDNVSDLDFNYLDANGLETHDVDNIRTVEITLTVEEPAGREGFLSRTYSTRVICRNLGLQ
jgi:prepilin-type N-terminal cleavage/methylation domain-containing protein